MKITKYKVAQFLGSRRPVRTFPRRILGYAKKYQFDEFVIYQRGNKIPKVAAAFQNTVVLQKSGTQLVIIPHYGCPGIRYKVDLNSKMFPGLWDDSIIMKCLLLPYMRVTAPDCYSKAVRLCVITDKGQIYHNWPARRKGFDGPSASDDIIRFEESVVWDLPGRKYPSQSQNLLETEVYFPNLPKECYEYHPVPNDIPTFIDRYGNGGFGKSKTMVQNGNRVVLSRFYQYARTPQSNSFHFIGTGTKSWKMNIIGTYRANVEEGVRTCIFATDDGGRVWYCKYEFSDMGEYSFQQGHTGNWGRNFGHPIIISDKKESELISDLALVKRKTILPTLEDKNIRYEWIQKCRVERIISDQGTILETKEPHGLATGNIVALTGMRRNTSSLYSWLISEEDALINGDCCIQFKVEVISPMRVKLYELVSSAQPSLPCRHIHHINMVKDGWLVGTGEIYPNSWLLYFQQKAADTFTMCHAGDTYSIIPLNYAETSVERTMGAILRDDKRNTLIYASDHDTSSRETINANGVSFSRNSTGVFIGKLQDINDREQFECILETREPCFYFQELDGMYVFCGQRGELALSSDVDKTRWTKCSLDDTVFNYYGNIGQFYFFDNIAILKK